MKTYIEKSYEKKGWDIKSLEDDYEYLSELFAYASYEVLEKINGKPVFKHIPHDFHSVSRLLDILKKYELKDSDSFVSANYINFPYDPILDILQKDDPKKMKQFSEFALEMGLLCFELKNVETLQKGRLKNLKSFLLDLSRKYMAEAPSYKHDLNAA